MSQPLILYFIINQLSINNQIADIIINRYFNSGQFKKSQNEQQYNYLGLTENMSLYRDILQPISQQQPIKRNIRPLNQPAQSPATKPISDHAIVQLQVNKNGNQKINKESKTDFKRTFLIFSRLHNCLKLKHETLFLALQLHRKYSLGEGQKNIPEVYLQAVCLYLAMKYEEIYPPRFKNFCHLISNTIMPSQYNKYQFLFLQAIDANLDIPSGKKIIDELLQNQTEQTYCHAYYLLQLCYGAAMIGQPYSLMEITSSIIYSMNPFNESLKKVQKFNDIEIEKIVDCTKLILQLKYKACVNESALYKKYSKSNYESAALKTITIQK